MPHCIIVHFMFIRRKFPSYQSHSKVVEYTASPELFHPNSEARGCSHVNIRCFSTRTGSCLPGGNHQGTVDIKRNLLAHQPIVVEGNFPCLLMLPEGESFAPGWTITWRSLTRIVWKDHSSPRWHSRFGTSAFHVRSPFM